MIKYTPPSNPPKPLILLVPGPGIEPGRPCGHEILSLERLPIPPSRHSCSLLLEATIGVEPISKVLQTSA